MGISLRPVRKGRGFGALTTILSEMQLGAYKSLSVASTTAYAAIHGERGPFRAYWPERRFVVNAMGPGRCMVTRIPDKEEADPEWLWSEIVDAVAGTEKPVFVGKDLATVVPGSCRFGVWARAVGVGRWFMSLEDYGRGPDGNGWIVLHHGGGASEQRVVIKRLRDAGVACWKLARRGRKPGPLS